MIRSFYRGLINAPASASKRNKILFRTAVSLGILGLLFWLLPIDTLLTAIKKVPAGTWLLVITGFLFGHIVSAFKWRLLLHATDVAISGREAIRAHGAGLFANLCLPSVVGGDLVRAGVIIRDRGQFEHVALGSLADRINDTFALVVIAAIAGLFVPELADLPAGKILAGMALTLLLLVITAIVSIRYLRPDHLPDKLSGLVSRLQTALGALSRSPAPALTALSLSILVQSGFIVLNIVLARAMGIDAAPMLWFMAWPMAKLIALAPISLGGLGVREAAIAGIMSPFGLDASLVVAQSLSWQAVLILSGLFAGLVAALLPGYNIVKQGQEATQRE